jgi:hypothetical protein
MKHVLTAGAIAAGTLILCAGCGSNSTTASTGVSSTNSGTTAATGASSSASATGGGSSTTTTGGATATTSAASGGSGSGSGANGSLSTCQSKELSASVANEQGTAGSVYVDIVFKNLSSQACTLDGYPGVSFGAGSPVTQVGRPASREATVSPANVTLLPNGHAYAVLQVGDAENYPSSTCKPTATTSLLVYPPNNTGRLTIPFKSTACAGDVVTMHVEAVQPGAGS